MLSGSPLHEAAAAGNVGDIKSLMLLGASPCVVDVDGRVPYLLAETRLAKLAFIRHRKAFPEQWDYVAAKIPQSWNEERKRAEPVPMTTSADERAMERIEKDLQKLDTVSRAHGKSDSMNGDDNNNDDDDDEAALAESILRRKSRVGGGGSAGAALRAKQKRDAQMAAARAKQEEQARQKENEQQLEQRRRREMMAAAAERRMAK